MNHRLPNIAGDVASSGDALSALAHEARSQVDLGPVILRIGAPFDRRTAPGDVCFLQPQKYGRPLAQRLQARTGQPSGPNGCRLFLGPRSRDGYGVISERGGRRTKAHRIAWELHHQQRIPAGMVIMHSCDNPPCVNPAHLRLGTHADNSADKVSKGRQARKLLPAQVAEIRRRYQAGGVSQRSLGAEYGVTERTVQVILRGRDAGVAS